MQRIDVSVYQFSVHGLYNPRQSGFFGYVATTLVMVGVSIERSSSNSSTSDLAMMWLPFLALCWDRPEDSRPHHRQSSPDARTPAARSTRRGRRRTAPAS